MSQFNVNFKLKSNDMVYVTFSYYYEYWTYQTIQTGNTGTLNEFRRVSQSWGNKDKTPDIQIKVILSSKLAFILGFKKIIGFHSNQ